MFTYNIEYRENILFIRLIGSLNKNTIKYIDSELDNIVNNLGIYNIVFNFQELIELDNYERYESTSKYDLKTAIDFTNISHKDKENIN